MYVYLAGICLFSLYRKCKFSVILIFLSHNLLLNINNELKNIYYCSIFFISTIKDVIYMYVFFLHFAIACSSNPGPAMTRLQLDTQSERYQLYEIM